MAQFYVMIVFSLIFNLLLFLYVYYAYNIQRGLPSYVETKKFRNKISSEFNDVKTIVSLGSYTSILDFKYFKGFVYNISVFKKFFLRVLTFLVRAVLLALVIAVLSYILASYIESRCFGSSIYLFSMLPFDFLGFIFTYPLFKNESEDDDISHVTTVRNSKERKTKKIEKAKSKKKKRF